LSKDINNFEVKFVKKYVDLYDKLFNRFLINDIEEKELNSYITNEMENKKSVIELKKLIDNNFILYTIKL
ncbi:hypothetical protein, partial [Mycobacterium sp.]|uniref:hypothetical protein n=1 Tax=Mycobacterium sp. TaxID=1785 RepID=UPI0031DA0363